MLYFLTLLDAPDRRPIMRVFAVEDTQTTDPVQAITMIKEQCREYGWTTYKIIPQSQPTEGVAILPLVDKY